MNTILLVVDVQDGFLRDDKDFLERIRRHAFSGYYDEVISTIFINKENSNYVKMLGWTKLMTEEEPLVDSSRILLKNGYGLHNYNDLQKDNICYDIVGISTEACVMKIATDLFDNNFRFRVLTNLCKSTDGKEMHEMAVRIMKRNLGNSIL